MIRHERLQQLMDAKGFSQAALAREIGVAQPTIFKLVSGQSANSVHLHKIARALNTTVEYLTGETHTPTASADGRSSYTPEPPEASVPMGRPVRDHVMIPEVDISFSMGSGLVLADHAEASMVPFPRDWLRSLVKGNFNQVFVARGEGDSMQPTVLDGDIVIIDTSQNALTSQDRLWCIGYGELGMIKRLRARSDGGIDVMSDNSAVNPFTAYDGEVQIFGRVVFIGRKM